MITELEFDYMAIIIAKPVNYLGKNIAKKINEGVNKLLNKYNNKEVYNDMLGQLDECYADMLQDKKRKESVKRLTGGNETKEK